MVTVSYKCPGCSQRIFYADKECSQCHLKIVWEKVFVPVPAQEEDHGHVIIKTEGGIENKKIRREQDDGYLELFKILTKNGKE